MKKTIIQTEQNALGHFLEKMFGYYLLQMGGPQQIDYLAGSPIKNKIYYAPTLDCNKDFVCISGDYASLPFMPNSVDVIIIPHTLENTTQPQQILQEAYHALIPEGYLVIVGFNPISLHGLVQLFKSTDHKLINISKLNNWLLQMGFVINETKLLKHALLNEGIGHILWPGRDIYIVVAQKKTVGLTPILQKQLKKQKVVVRA